MTGIRPVNPNRLDYTARLRTAALSALPTLGLWTMLRGATDGRFGEAAPRRWWHRRTAGSVKVFRCGSRWNAVHWRDHDPRWETSQGGSRGGLGLSMGKERCGWGQLSRRAGIVSVILAHAGNSHRRFSVKLATDRVGAIWLSAGSAALRNRRHPGARTGNRSWSSNLIGASSCCLLPRWCM